MRIGALVPLAGVEGAEAPKTDGERGADLVPEDEGREMEFRLPDMPLCWPVEGGPIDSRARCWNGSNVRDRASSSRRRWLSTNR